MAKSGSRADFSVRRDWAAISGGASVVDFNGPDYTEFGCGPAQALDTSQATGWGSTTGSVKGEATNVFQPKHLTVDLGRAVNITTFGVDPTSTCGDAFSASTGAFQIETSPDNVTYTVAAQRHVRREPRGKMNTVTPTTGTVGVRYVRFTILGNQVPDFATNCPNGGFSGCQFTDLTELEVYGARRRRHGGSLSGGIPVDRIRCLWRSNPQRGRARRSCRQGTSAISARSTVTWVPTARRPFAVSDTHVVRQPRGCPCAP